MPENRIARHLDPKQVVSEWGAEVTGRPEMRYCDSDTDYSSPLPIDLQEYANSKNFWDAVEDLRRSESERRMQFLESRVESLENAALSMHGAIYPIDSLIPGSVIVEKTIHAQVTFDEGCHIACFVDANINASGESTLDAIEMLKDAIASTYLAFGENEHRLGREPARQLAVLREFVRGA